MFTRRQIIIQFIWISVCLPVYRDKLKAFKYLCIRLYLYLLEVIAIGSNVYLYFSLRI